MGLRCITQYITYKAAYRYIIYHRHDHAKFANATITIWIQYNHLTLHWGRPTGRGQTSEWRAAPCHSLINRPWLLLQLMMLSNDEAMHMMQCSVAVTIRLMHMEYASVIYRIILHGHGHHAAVLYSMCLAIYSTSHQLFICYRRTYFASKESPQPQNHTHYAAFPHPPYISRRY